VTLETGKPIGQDISQNYSQKKKLLLISSEFYQIVRQYPFPFDHPKDQLKPLQEGQDIGQLMATTEDFTIHYKN
jgi:hypothetical protein